MPSHASARDYLHKLQRAASGSRSRSAYDEHTLARYKETLAKYDPARRQQQEENLERQLAYHARYQALLPTPLQSVQDFARLFESKAGIDRELARVGEYKPRGNVVLGSIDTVSLNAQTAYLTDSDEYLVVFSRGLLLLLLLTSNLAAVSMSFAPEYFSDRIDEPLLDEAAPLYGELLAAVYAGEAPPLENAIPLFYAYQKEKRWTGIEDGAFDFVVAHEYAHILRGHLVQATNAFSDDWGGWGAEYEADSIAMDLAGQVCAAKSDANPAALALTMQGVCIFFGALCYIEQYGAEMRGDPASVWNVSKHHPPTYVRWRRMIEKVRSRTQGPLWEFYSTQMRVIELCLLRLYKQATANKTKRSAAYVEWHLQRAAWETMAGHRLVPQHLVIALRCARAALQAGAPLDDVQFGRTAAQADIDLVAAGARPLRSYVEPLPGIAHEMSARVLTDAQAVTPAVMNQFIERLIEVVMLDARTRYELPAAATNAT